MSVSLSVRLSLDRNLCMTDGDSLSVCHTRALR